MPGMRSSAPGMSPEKIAIAVAVTIDATAGTGGMKKVTGTSSAVAIVAVSPGMQPTNRPYTAEAAITVEHVRVEDELERLQVDVHAGRPFVDEVELVEDGQHAPGQRDAQQLVEHEVDEEHRADRHRHRHLVLTPSFQNSASRMRMAETMKPSLSAATM